MVFQVCKSKITAINITTTLPKGSKCPLIPPLQTSPPPPHHQLNCMDVFLMCCLWPIVATLLLICKSTFGIDNFLKHFCLFCFVFGGAKLATLRKNQLERKHTFLSDHVAYLLMHLSPPSNGRAAAGAMLVGPGPFSEIIEFFFNYYFI